MARDGKGPAHRRHARPGRAFEGGFDAYRGVFRPGVNYRDLFDGVPRPRPRNSCSSRRSRPGPRGRGRSHDAPCPARPAAIARALGRRGPRRRRDRPGHGARLGPARISDAAAGIARLRRGHVQPQHEAHPRRRALPRARPDRPGPRGPPRARRPAGERPAPGPPPAVRPADVSPRREGLLRDGPVALRPTRRPIEFRPLAVRLEGRGPDPRADLAARGASRRRRVRRRPVRRREARHRAPANVPRRGRHRPESCERHRLREGEGAIRGVSCRDAETGSEWTATARVVVNAGGCLRRRDPTAG